MWSQTFPLNSTIYDNKGSPAQHTAWMMTTLSFLPCNYEAKITKCSYVKLRKSCSEERFTLAVTSAETLIFSAGVKKPTQFIIPPMQMYFTSLTTFCSCFISYPFCVPTSSQHSLMLLHTRMTFIDQKNKHLLSSNKKKRFCINLPITPVYKLNTTYLQY